MRLAAQTFGRRLAAIRQSRGLSQSELADAVGRSPQTISAWELARFARVDARDIAACAHVLRCRVRDLRAPLDAPIPLCPSSWPRTRRRIKRHRRRFGFLGAGEKERRQGGGIKVRSGERRRPPDKPTENQSAPAEAEQLKALLLEVLQRLVRYDPDAVELLDRILQPAHPRPTFRV